MRAKIKLNTKYIRKYLTECFKNFIILKNIGKSFNDIIDMQF